MRKHSTRTPRPVRIPITRALLDEFAQELHFALMTATLGSFSKTSFDRIGATLNCIHGALANKPPQFYATSLVIEGAMRAMNECGTRGTRSGVWTLTLTERQAVHAGIIKAEEALQHLDVMALYESMQKCKAREAEEVAA